jgi:hypothetical protein
MLIVINDLVRKEMGRGENNAGRIKRSQALHAK